jgi:alpha-glucosidase
MSTAPALDSTATLLAEPHHDGSDAYVLERPREVGGDAVVQLRVPHAGSVDKVALRYIHDGEPAFVTAEREGETLWRATFPVPSPATRYRWLLAGGEIGYAWLNGNGVMRHDIPDADDFVMTVGDGGPQWHLDSVVYEIFPDRYASSGLDVDDPAWAMRRAWDELPRNRGTQQAYEFFGGDLRGIEQRLDHIESLGANAIYLTPFFPAGSSHRYDATSFEHVDPLLGGDHALASLVRAAHARGIRVIGDLTINHVGIEHEWFESEPEFFYRDDSELGYEAWLGVPSLPKLNHGSPRLASALRAVVQQWLRPPYDLDGWRIDVANMAGRLGAQDLGREVARGIRDAAVEAKPDAVLIAEHGHDYRDDLAGDGWHGAMNDAGFLRPVWWWLRDASFARDPFRADFPAPIFSGQQSVATMRAFRAGVPWPSTLHSWTLLDSHDSPRFSRVVRTRARHVVGVGLQMTTPGVPMLFAGDEVGLEGDWGEDARRPMPWDTPESWDGELLEQYRALIALRRSEPALARGGIRYVHVSAEAIAYVRETADEALLCLAVRGAHDPIRVPFASLETLYGDDVRDGVLPADGPSFHVWRLMNG